MKWPKSIQINFSQSTQLKKINSKTKTYLQLNFTCLALLVPAVTSGLGLTCQDSCLQWGCVLGVTGHGNFTTYIELQAVAAVKPGQNWMAILGSRPNCWVGQPSTYEGCIRSPVGWVATPHTNSNHGQTCVLSLLIFCKLARSAPHNPLLSPSNRNSFIWPSILGFLPTLTNQASKKDAGTIDYTVPFPLH